jgi:Zn-dependent protease
MAIQRESSWVENFMASNYGRVARGVLGIALIGAGLGLIGGTAGWIIAAFGLVPIAAGVFNLCPVAPLWGGHFLGSRYCARNPWR